MIRITVNTQIKNIIGNIFKKNITRSILLDSDIHVLTPLDAIKLILKDYKGRMKVNEQLFSSQKANSVFFQLKKLIIFSYQLFINLPITAFRGNLISVPLNLCTNQTAFSYGNEGWHWNKELAAEVNIRPDIAMEETRFYKFFQNIHCTSYTQSMTFFNESLMKSLPEIPYGSFPWGHFDREIDIDPQNYYDTTNEFVLWFKTGQDINDILHIDFKRTVDLLTNIKYNGFNIRFSKYQFPVVVILKNKLGKVRFLNVDGAHRFAVLSALGYKRVVVRLLPDRYPPILEEDVESWPYVQSGLLKREDALKLFGLYFTLNGNERANI